MRYFIITYNWGSKDQFGWGNVSYTNRGYPNQKTVIHQLMTQNSEISDLAIVNIIELNEEDFKNWIQS